MPTTHTIRDEAALEQFLPTLRNMPIPFRVTVAEGEGRSLSQNALLHKWFGEIARQSEGETLVTIKGVCHRKYGLSIRQRDPQFAWIWQRTGARMNYEQQCKLLASGILGISSQMTKAELSEYMDAMSRDYRAEGFRLTDPEGWE